ncbi:SDR family NAD(P)-dependent oxidoreductase [Kineosporia sp. A_224]|uniref:SDR family NAD(P)-dependent oxidoreductase n=1 Tax=Kineosporia sp. A_224 TaxID=1962180 RepID=UPI000B4AA5AC|nr:SDR family NAD(P)-dependent oxidoreductase [Kineosporia sp. A_224]
MTTSGSRGPGVRHALRVLAGYAGRDPSAAALRHAVGGRVVLVTGASEGIGAATARRLGAAGATVLLVARTRGRLEAVRREIVAAGGAAHVHPVDLARPEDVGALAAAVLAEHGRVDVVVSNAGHSIRRSVADSAGRFHDVERLIGVNHLGPVRLLLDLLPSMRERGRGHVVNVSTVGLGLPTPSWTAYLSSKGAFEIWLRTAAPELRADGVTVSTVHLGLVRTRMSAPTAQYRNLPAMTADEAAGVVCRAVLRRGRWYPWWGRLAVLAAGLAPDAAQTVATLGVRLARATEPLRVVAATGALGPRRLGRLLRAVVRYGPAPAAALAAADPAAVVVVDVQGPVTAGALMAGAQTLARRLRADGVRAGDRVALDRLDGRHLVVGLVGATLAGADAVMLAPDLPPDRCERVLRTAGVTVVLRPGPDGAPVPEPGPAPEAGAGRRSPGGRPARRRVPRVVPLTSGTTGTPRAVPRDVPLRVLVGPLTTHLARIPMRTGEAVVVAAPVHHGYGLVYLVAGLALGCPVVLAAGLAPQRLLEVVAEHEARAVFLLPIHLRRMAAAARQPDGTVAPQHLPRLRAVVSGAAPLTASTLADGRALFGERVFNLFGTTEAAWATLATPADLRAAPGTVGRPPRGVTLRVVDAAGAPVPRGTTGRVLVGGWSPDGGLVPTGDLGHVDVAGRLFLDGRDDEMVVSGGENVYPAPVLAAIEAHPDVADAVVRPVPDDEFGTRLAATACRRPGTTLGPQELREWLRPRLSRAEMPRDLEVVDDVPRTATGKPRRER